MHRARSPARLVIGVVIAACTAMNGTLAQATPSSTVVLLPYLTRGWVVSESVPRHSQIALSRVQDNPFHRAAFGSGGNCPLARTVHTSWPVNSTIVIWHEFTVPSGATNVRVAIAIDNDVSVFVNGTNVSGGLQTHEGCAVRDTFMFSVPANILYVNNLLRVVGVDRGEESYLDAEVLADV
jgi:hypothetical protein